MKNFLLKNLFLSTISSLILGLSACSSDLTEPELIDNQVPTQSVRSLGSDSVARPKSKQEFISIAKSYRVSLKNEDFSYIQKLANIRPTGEWTPGPEQDSKQNLTKHFLKHGDDFRPKFSSEEDYLKAAIKATTDTSENSSYYFDAKYFLDDNMISVVKWNSKTYEFTVMRDNGQIATYFLDNKLAKGRFILVPSDMR